MDVYQREARNPRSAHRAVLCGCQGGDVASVHLDQSRGGDDIYALIVLLVFITEWYPVLCL